MLNGSRIVNDWRRSGAVLRLNFQVPNTFNIVGLIAKSTLKLINDRKNKIFRNIIFEMKVVT